MPFPELSYMTLVMMIPCPLAAELSTCLSTQMGFLALRTAPLQSALITQDLPFTFLVKIKLLILLYLTGMF